VSSGKRAARRKRLNYRFFFYISQGKEQEICGAAFETTAGLTLFIHERVHPLFIFQSFPPSTSSIRGMLLL